MQFLNYPICRAQSQDSIIFHPVSPPRGSSNSGGNGGVQDLQGYMWFAYYGGLHRFDGYHYTSYFHDPLNPNSLAANDLEAVYADHKGFIWISFYEGNGLDRLEPITGVFTHFRHNLKNKNSLVNDTVLAILEDHEGLIWVGTRGGLDRLSMQTGVFTHYQHNPADTTSLSFNVVHTLYEDKQGTLWIGTGSPFIPEFPGREGGLNRYDPKSGTFRRYQHDRKNEQSLIDNRVKAIFEDSQGTFWVGTAGDGLHTMNRKQGTFTRYRYDSTRPEKLSRPAQKSASWADDQITFITEDASGAIWIGTLFNGLNRYDPKTKKTIHFPPLMNKETGEPPDHFWWASNSRDGILWIGSWSRTIRVDPWQKRVPYVTINRAVSSIFEDASGVRWYGCRRGLLREEGTQPDHNALQDELLIQAVSHNLIVSMYQDHQKILWVGTDSGLCRYDREKQSFIRYLPDLGNYSSLVRSGNWIDDIYEDRHGSFWVGTQKGLYKMDRERGTFARYLNNPADTTSLGNKQAWRIYEDHSGYLWIGTVKGGLVRLSLQTGAYQRFLNGAEVSSLLEDADGVLWVGTLDGLYRSNSSHNGFSRFISTTTETVKDVAIRGLLEDNQKALWVNTRMGILRINQQRNEVFIYNETYGVNTSRFNFIVGYHKAKSGELFFGDLVGYYAFFPEQLTGNAKPPEIVIHSFSLADKPVVVGRDGPLLQPLAQTTTIRLQHNQNVFSFGFTGLHYSAPEANRHMFMLEGLDNEWRKAGEEKMAYYYNVPPGHYIFRVRASNSDGVWAEKKIVVIVLPPWWRTWWATILFAFLLAGLIYALVQYRINKIRMQHEIVLQKHRAIELEMQALRAQMNPHFIFNSLSSINRFILQNDKPKASEYLTKFARLVRLILQNSGASLIPFESELESLRLYLELEAVRFNFHFEYRVTISDELDIDILKVPPLLFQPFAENAIWHGLMHKEEKGHLEIDLFQCDKFLCCKITDDGIGRQRATELKSKSASTHKSMGMRITADRIAMLQEKKQIYSAIQITDLVSPDGSAAGTEVLLKIPLLYD